MTNILRSGLGVVIAGRARTYSNRGWCDAGKTAGNGAVLLAARHFPCKARFFEAQAPHSSDASQRGDLTCLLRHDVLLRAESVEDEAFKTRVDSLPVTAAMRSTPDLPACVSELPIQPLCDEHGQLLATPIAAVLRQAGLIASVREARLVELSQRSARHGEAASPQQPMALWEKQALNYRAPRLRRASDKAARIAGDLERWSQRLEAGGGKTVSLEDTDALAWSLGSLARQVSRADLRLVEILRRLKLQADASLATQYKARVEAVLYRKYEPFSHPGARSEQRLDTGLGLGAGACAGVGGTSTGVDAGASLGLSQSRALGNDDEGFVQESRATTFGFGVEGKASFPAAIKARLSASLFAQRSRYIEYEGVRHLVVSPESRVHRAHHREIRSVFKDSLYKVRSLEAITKHRRDAACQDTALARAIGGIELCAPDGRRVLYRVHSGIHTQPALLPSKGAVRQVAGRLDAEASLGLPAGFGVAAQLAGGMVSSRIRQNILQPFWAGIGAPLESFRDLEGEGVDKPARADALDMQKRQQAILHHALSLNPALAVLGARHAGELKPGASRMRKDFALNTVMDRTQLCRILQDIEDQFDLYALAAREVASGKREAAALMRDFERFWGVTGRVREAAYLQAICLAHTAIALRLRQLAVERQARGDTLAAGQWRQDWTRLDLMWRKLETAELSHRRLKLMSYISFRNVVCPTVSERYVSLSLGASGSWGLAREGARIEGAAEVTVSARFRRRHHPNYLREGHYIDIQVGLAASGALAMQYGVVLQHLDGLESQLGLPTQALREAFQLAGTTPLLLASAESGAQVLVRFFRPACRTEGAAAYRLQFVRVLSTQGVRLQSGAFTLPVGPVSATIVAGAASDHWRVRAEWLGDTTLSYVMLRYNRMHARAPFPEDGEWSRFTTRHRRGFERLFARLGEPGSDVSTEAQYMMKQHVEWAKPAARAEVLRSQLSMREAMRAYRSSRSEADFVQAMQCFEAVLAHQLDGWSVAKVGQRRYWEIDDRIRLAR